MNPAVMQNATYTWTKLLTAFFVILAVCLYLSGWRKRDSVRMTAAFCALAAGLLVHYSAGPYVVFFALHYLLVVFRTRPAKWKELAAIAVSLRAAAVHLVRLVDGGVRSRSQLSLRTPRSPPAKQVQGSNPGQDRRQCHGFHRAPYRLRPGQVHLFDQPYAPAVVRDNVFLLYNTNLIFSMGLIRRTAGGLVRDRRVPQRQRAAAGNGISGSC